MNSTQADHDFGRLLLSLPTAADLESQLGLKLENGTALVDQLVIENIEKPVDD